MGTAHRRYPRVSIDEPGELEVLIMNEDSTYSRRSMNVAVRSISCEGAGLAFVAPPELTVRAGSPVTVRLPVNDGTVNLPGKIAWALDGSMSNAPFDVGVRLQPEAADRDSRERYAPWVVDLIARNRSEAMLFGGLLVRLAGLPLATLQTALDKQAVSGGRLGTILQEMNAIAPTQLERLAAFSGADDHYRVPPQLQLWRDSITSLGDD